MPPLLAVGNPPLPLSRSFVLPSVLVPSRPVSPFWIPTKVHGLCNDMHVDDDSNNMNFQRVDRAFN